MDFLHPLPPFWGDKLRLALEWAATLALNGGYRFSERVALTAGVDNVFDRLYSEHLNLAGSADFGYPADPIRINEPGRSAWVKLNLRY